MNRTRSTGDPLVSVRNLRVSFRLDRETTFEAVRGISFDIPRNSTVALVGESGSGKSVTSLAMLGLLPPETQKAELDTYVRAELAAYKAPRIWVFVDDFPMTPSGKVQKFVLRDRLLSGELQPD